MELAILLLGSAAIFLCPVRSYVRNCPDTGEHYYITEEVRSAACNTSAYQALYYKENQGQGRYYTDENEFIQNIYGDKAVMLGTINAIYERNVTETKLDCKRTQKKFILEIGLTCVLRNLSIDDSFPNPIVLRHDCPFLGIKVSDDVIFSPRPVSHSCRRVSNGPCLGDDSERWKFNKITLFKRGPSVMGKLVRICGLYPQRPQNTDRDLCPRVTVTKDTCDSGTLLLPVAAVYMFLWSLMIYIM